MKIVIRPSPSPDFETYQRSLRYFEQFRSDTLAIAGTVHSGNVDDIAERVRLKEVAIVEEMLASFAKVPEEAFNPAFPICQSGDTCVPMSVSNSLLVLKPGSFFGDTHSDQIAATNHLIDHFLAKEPGHDRGERRSLDRVAHYFSNGFQKELGIAQNYRFELTGSLIKMIYAMHSRSGTVLSVFRAHCQIGYGIYRDGDNFFVEMKDPLIGQNKALAVDQFAEYFAWSALAGLPNAVANNAIFDAEGAEKLIDDQQKRNNSGILCSSGILWHVKK